MSRTTEPAFATRTVADAPGATPGASTLTAQYAIDLASVERVRRMHAAQLVLALLAAIGFGIFADGTGPVRVLVGGLLLGAVTSGGILLYLRSKPGELPPDSPLVGAIFAVPGTLATFAILYYFGFFSFGQGVIGIAIFGTTSGAPRRLARLNYVAIALVPLIGMVGVALGFLPDAGRTRAIGSTTELLVCAGIVQVYYFGVFQFALQSNAILDKTVGNLERALREIARREVIVAEMRRDLARAMEGAGPASGSTVGSWRLGAMLGRGGMGEVYRAESTVDGRVAAVKLLADGSHDDPELVARFQREAEAMKRLAHPNVVALLDVGPRFLAMELLEGEDLAAVLRERTMLPPEEVVVLVREVASALDAARAADVVHRDLKPYNLFRVRAPRSWKVLDFGISKLGGGGATLTQGVIGTPAYMAPEHVDGTRPVHATDVFSLALVAYRALTGQPAFSGESAQIMADVMALQPSRPSELAALHEDVDLALALGLAKAPKDRVDALVLADALAAAIRGELPAEQRERGRELVKKHRWGTRR